jgi:hypothetical protein
MTVTKNLGTRALRKAVSTAGRASQSLFLKHSRSMIFGPASTAELQIEWAAPERAAAAQPGL